MKRYKLINEGRGAQLIKELEEHLENKQKSFDKHGDVWLDRCPLYYFKGAIYIIKKYHKDNLDDEFNNFITDDYLTSTEATLLLNGLNPAAGSDIDSDTESIPRGGDDCGYDILHDYLYENNKEFRKLAKAVKAKDGFAFEEDSEIHIYTDALIPWATKQGFIEEVAEPSSANDSSVKKLRSGGYDRDQETGIPIHRFEVYQETLPDYLDSLDEPISKRGLTKPDDVKDGEYTLMIKDRLGVGGATTKTEIPSLIKNSSWWKSLPESTRNKIKK
jgi:hypothetical protein